MLILLPSEKSSVRSLTRDLQHDRFISILEQLEPTELSVEIPRFEIDYNTGLEDYLKEVSVFYFLCWPHCVLLDFKNCNGCIHKYEYLTFLNLSCIPTDKSFKIKRSNYTVFNGQNIFDHLQSIGFAYSISNTISYLQLKIREIFLPTANLSIVEQQNVKISNIIHKTHIEVNEKGSVAAAATGAVVIPLMGSSMPRFVANRPFVFFIYHVKTGNILFEGQYSQPREILNTATPLQSRNFRQPITKNYNLRQRAYQQPTQQNYYDNY